MTSTWKRGLSLFVALMMIVSIIPFNALAEEVTPENTETQTPVENETEAPTAPTDGEIPAGEVSRGMYSTSNNRIQGAVMNANPKNSVVLELYSGGTKIATTTLTDLNYLANAATELTWSFCITDTSSSWSTVWEEGHPVSYAKPDKVVLYIDNTMVAENIVTLHKDNFDMAGEEAVWAELDGVSYLYTISSADELQEFAFAVKNGDTFAGKTVKLTADIDLGGMDWPMIGSYGAPFSGEFDGNGKTISNLTDSTANDHKGLFAHLNEAYVHDLYLKDVSFSGICEGALYAGALVAEAESKNVIENVKVHNITWTITSKSGSIGSIAGYSYDTVYVGCTVQDATFNVISTSSVNMGGMVGQGRGVGTFTTAYGNTETTSYVNCAVDNVTFDVTGKTTVGGFLGCDGYNHWANYGANCSVTNLTVNCAADDAQYTVGGFMGSNNGANYGKDYAFVNCSTSGVINAGGNSNIASTFGGFVGYVGGRPTALGECTANVTISVSAGDVGGFCGETQQYFAHAYEFNGCAATGDVSTNNGNAGGFIANVQHGGDGSALNTTITGCTASGSVTTTNGVAGGIIANVNDVKKDNPTGGDVTVSGNTNNTNVTTEVGSDVHDLAHAPYVATIGEQGYESLAEAIAAVQDSETIVLAAGTHKWDAGWKVQNKAVTFTGTDAVIDMTNVATGQNTSGATLNFNGVTVKFATANYKGFQHTAKVTYTDCTIEGTQFLYAPEVSFTGCTFTVTGDAYAVWTYGASNVTFENCEFNTDGKAILVYTEAAHTAEINVSGCTFVAGTNREKAAIEVGQSAYGNKANYTVNITESTADANFVANMSTSNLWGNKNLMDFSGLSLVVDDEAVTLPVAFINRVGYATLADAIAVVQDGETIVLAAGYYSWDAGWKIQNKEVTFTKANADDAVLIDMVNIATGQNTSGATLNFKGLSMGFGTENYRGFQHTAKVTYTDCILNGKQFLYAPTVEFTNCTINNYADYSVWTYGASDVKFTGCTFNSGGKAVLVYNEDTTGSFVADIALDNCTFTDNDTLDTNKGAVELGNNPNKTNVYHIAFTGCTVNGFAVNDEGTSTGSTFWGNKNSMDSGNGSSVTIDGGENLMPESKILVINNLDELKAFRDSVNGGKTYEGMTVLLAADIDLGNELWTPIGTHTNIFSGTFDGQSHTISNLYISAETSRQGLFGCAGGVTIKNLTIHNAYVDSTNGSSIAVLIGHGDHNGVETKGHVLENIKITGLVQIKGVSGMGTVIGTAPNVNFTASNITVDVENGSYVDSTRNIMEGYPAGRYYSYTGGVFGQVWGSKFENITSNIDVIGACVGTGGITGGATGTWTNITHTGDVIIAGEKDMGYWYANKDENGNAYGLIYWWQGAGLISGYHGGTTFENCVSTGTLTYQADNTNTNEIYYNATLINPETRETIDTVTLCDSRFGSSRWNSDNTITVIDYAELGEDNQPVLPIVAKVGEAGYTTLQEAIEAAIPSNGTVILVTDVVEKGIKVPAEAVITIDLAGHTLYGDILSEGDLTIKNGTVKGTRFVSAIESCGEAAKLTTVNLEVISYRHALRIEGGEAIINGGTYTTLGKVDGDSDVHAVNAGGAYATTVTIKDGTFVGPKGSANTNSADSGSAVQAQANATVIIENGKFSGGQNHTLNATNGGSISVTGGEFDQDPAAYAAEGYKSEASATTEGWFTVVEDNAVAAINGVKYESIDAAFAAAKSGDEIVLLQDCTASKQIKISRAITLNLNGHTLSADKVGIFMFQIMADFTVTGEGSIVATGIDEMFNVGNVKLTLSGNADYISEYNVIRPGGTAQVDIQAGTLTSQKGAVLDEYADYENTTITKGADVAIEAPEGFKWQNNTLTAIVYVAQIGVTKYESIQAAIDAVESGKTTQIVLLMSTTETGIKIPADKQITLNLGGFTLTGDIYSEGKLTVCEGTINSETFTSAIESNGASAALILSDLTVTSQRHALRIEGGMATIFGGTYTTVGRVGLAESVHALNAGGNGTTKVFIYGGTFNGLGENAENPDSSAAINAQAGATVTIDGSTADVKCVGGQLNTLATTNGGTIKVTAGEYDQDVTEYVADGYHSFDSDNDGLYEVEQHTEAEIPAVDPTFTTVGWTEGVKCGICGKVLVAPTEVPMLIPGAKNDTTGKLYIDLFDALADANDGDTIILLADVEWETSGQIDGNPLADHSVIIDGQGKYTLTATGDGIGAIRVTSGTLTLKDLTVVDESVSYAESAWEMGYLEFDGNLIAENVTFSDPILFQGETAAFTNCTFTGKTNQYGCWIHSGKATFTGCIFDGTRGLKAHSAYGNVVSELTVTGSEFNCTDKPGIALGDVTGSTVTVTNNTFNGVKAGDQNQFTFESDTALDQFTLTRSGNIISNVSSAKDVVAGTYEYDPTDYLAEGYKATNNGDGTWTVVEEITGNITQGCMSTVTETRTRLTGELTVTNSGEKLVIELYSGETKIATSTLVNADYIGKDDVTLSWNFVIKGEESSSWKTEWVEGYFSADYEPTKVVLVIDGEKIAENTVTMNANNDLAGTWYNWADFFKTYVAQIGETKYETLDEALNNAKSGDVVEVITDIDNAGTLMIRPGVTLNIGAHTVKADYVVGLKGSMITGIPQSKDSTVPYAKLIVAQDSVVMPEGCYNNGTYDVLPVYNPAGYYEFSYFRVRVISDGVELTEESLYFQFVVDASGVAKADLLANGASDNGISIVVRLTWTTATGTAYQDFVFADEHIEAVFAPNSTANFYIRITGYQALGITGENLVVSGVVISETGAESAS